MACGICVWRIPDHAASGEKSARLIREAERPLFGNERWFMAVDLVMIQITLNEGRTVELKKALYKAIAEGLHKAIGLKPQDVFISLVEVRKENWSFGDGVAQYAP